MAEGNPEGLEALFALLPELYAPVDAEQFPQRLVRLIEKLIPCWNVGFNEVDFLRARPPVWCRRRISTWIGGCPFLTRMLAITR